MPNALKQMVKLRSSLRGTLNTSARKNENFRAKIYLHVVINNSKSQL